MKPLRLLAPVALAAALAPLPAIEITLPAETDRLIESKLAGYTLATTYCYTCHSTDYVRVQPPGMNRAAWRASVVKMQKTFGAQIPEDAIDPIAEYLARTYGAERVAAKK
jgi:hypothetical protein